MVMAYKDMREFIALLEGQGELRRVKAQVSPDLEISHLATRMMRLNGPALLFEKVDAFQIPLLINLFGSMRRMALALGVEDIEEVARRVEALLSTPAPSSWMDRFRLLPQLLKLSQVLPRMVSRGECQEVVKEEPSLMDLPVLKCWPKDAGKFITFPMVLTKSLSTGKRNAGIYRMQVYDSKTTGMHFHPHKDAAMHLKEHKEAGKKMEVAVAIGCDPCTLYSASAPLPRDFDEIAFSGFLRGEGVEMTKGVTVDSEVPAHAEIVLEGYVDPFEEMRMEGPFGDHTGYYSPPEPYPVFHLTCMTQRREPFYLTTVVGRPTLEDYFLGKATERLFLPLVRLQLPEVRDWHFPPFGLFHNFLFVSIEKQYPYHAHKVMHCLWGLGGLMLTKCIVVVDKEIDVQNREEVWWAVGCNVEPKRDITFASGPMDALEHASPAPLYGSKMGIDATKKGQDEGHSRPWPEMIQESPEVLALLERKWQDYGLKDLKTKP